MQVHLFRGPGRIFAVTKEAAGGNLPVRYTWAPVKTIELVKGVPTPGLNTDECLADLETFGVHITDAHVRITEQAI
jgi:hypothetical protein